MALIIGVQFGTVCALAHRPNRNISPDESLALARLAAVFCAILYLTYPQKINPAEVDLAGVMQ